MSEDFQSGYRFMEHTADIGVHARGETLEDSFKQLGLGMMAVLMEDPTLIRTDVERSIELEAEDLEELVIFYLSELLFLFDVDHLLFSEFNLELQKTGEGWQLQGTLEGEKYDPRRHPYPAEIKAVTRHMLELSRKPPFDIKVIFDL